MKGLGALAAVLLGMASAIAHVNDRGMDYSVYKDHYGQSCCNVRDCRPAADFIETVVDGEPAVRLLIDGAWITVPRTFVIAAEATDGRAHFCGRLHRPNGNPADVKPEPYCVILPPRDS